jgi:uncharacterized protein
MLGVSTLNAARAAQSRKASPTVKQRPSNRDPLPPARTTILIDARSSAHRQINYDSHCKNRTLFTKIVQSTMLQTSIITSNPSASVTQKLRVPSREFPSGTARIAQGSTMKLIADCGCSACSPSRWPTAFGRGLIWLYRHSLSPLIGFHCRHVPTCSVYADEALQRYGLWAGGWITLARILRCQPWGTSGIDRVPVTRPEGARWYMPWRYARWRGVNDAAD